MRGAKPETYSVVLMYEELRSYVREEEVNQRRKNVTLLVCPASV